MRKQPNYCENTANAFILLIQTFIHKARIKELPVVISFFQFSLQPGHT